MSEHINKSVVVGRSKVAAAVRAALGLGLAFSASAFAQTAGGGAQPGANSESTDLGEIVVTGIRRQLETAQARKQEAPELVDAITADDIGALPDRSVTEVLQRIPGLAIGRVPQPRDADRIAIEGAGVTIRGLSWVRSELNGHSSFSAKNSRVLGFEDVPPELLAGVDVYKNPSAQQIEGGLSGTVNLRTRLPFDSEGRKISFSVEEAWGDLAQKWQPSGSALFSDRWETGAGEFGALVSASYSDLSSRTDTLHIDKYYANTNLIPGQTVFAPGGIGWRELTIDRNRQGASAALQWKSPSEKVDASLQYFYSDATFEQDENAVWNLPGNALKGTNLQFDGNQLIGGDIYDGGGNFVNGVCAPMESCPSGYAGSARYNNREARNDDVSFHVNWNASDNLRFEGDVQYSKASTKIIDLTMGPAADPNNANTLTQYTLQLHGSGEPTIVIPAAANALLSDPSFVYHNFAMDHHEDNDADAWAYRADGDYTFDNSDWLDKIRFGVRYEDYNSTTRETGYRWGSISQNWAGGPAVFNAQDVPYVQQNYSNWFHKGNVPSPFLFPNTNFFRNFDTWSQTVVDVSTAPGVNNGCCTWVPWDGDYSGKYPAADGLGINPQNQTTTAGYVQLSFKHEKWDGNVGVRYVKTKSSGQGLVVYQTATLSNAAPADDIAFSNGASVPTSGENDYNDVLPSLNVRYKAADNFFLRFAIGKGIARPDFPQMLPSNQITPTVGVITGGVCTPLPGGSTTPGTCVANYNGFSGNPDLKPMTSLNYDVSAEWYINSTNSLTLAVFDKELSGFIETTLGVVVPYTNNGVTKDVTVLRPENQGDGFTRGAELAWNGFFDFLPGWGKYFGARAAYTYVDSGGTRNAAANPYDPNQTTNSRVDSYPLEGLSRNSYNAELYYSMPKIEARLAYNWRERYLLTTAAANLNIPAFADDYGQLDASLSWRMTDSFSMGLEAVNLMHSKYKVLVDNDIAGQSGDGAGLTYHNWVDSDSRYSIYFRASF